MNKTILKDIKESKETLSLNKAFIVGAKSRIKELESESDEEGFNESGLYVYEIIKTQKEMINKRIEENQKLEKYIYELEQKTEKMLKYFKAERPLMELGRILTLLSKKYQNPFKCDTFNKYNAELWEIINFAIYNNKPFYLQYKTLIKECLKVYDYDLKKWC